MNQFLVHRIRFLFLCVFLVGTISAQEENDSLALKDEQGFNPLIGLGKGFLTYYGDVADMYKASPVFGRLGTSIHISKQLNDYFTINLSAIYGKLSGNEKSLERNLNFQTDVLVIGGALSYNFFHLFNKPHKVTPFVSLGLESYDYNSKTDLYDANGNLYHYWSDGTIRDIAEGTGVGNVLQRDFEYETDLRELNNDKLGNYPQRAYGLPVQLGFNMQITSRVSMSYGLQYHFAFSDLLDDVSAKGEGTRRGTKMPDRFLYSFVSMNVDLFSAEEEETESIQEYTGDADFLAIEIEDEDNDGVRDWDDLCPETEVGIKVDIIGCPMDNDKDGIPDYRDKDKHTSGKQIADLNGASFTDENLIEISEEPDALNYEEVEEFYPTIGGGVKGFQTSYLEIPFKFKAIDLNSDNYIGLDELNIAIDGFFDFSSNFTIDDVYELIEFFFNQ